MFGLATQKKARNKTEYRGKAVKNQRVENKVSNKPEKKPSLFARFDLERWRIRFVVVLFCLAWGGLWARAWYLQMVVGPQLASKAQRQHVASELVSGRRGMIFDRNGQVLARSVEARSVYVKPREVEDLVAMANAIAPILGKTPQELHDELAQTKRRFVWLQRKVDDLTASRILEARIPGVGLTKEFDRIYPFRHLAGQVLGFVGLDDNGLEGIERSMDEQLGCMPTRQVVQRDAMGRRFYLREAGQGEPHGEDVTLTLDVQLQFMAEETVAKAVRQYDARWGGAIVVDVANGDILAWAQYPFFNPNAYREYSPLIYRNRLAADALEPGSTFKPLVMAVALQEQKVAANAAIDCEGGKWQFKQFTIKDTSSHGIISASKVIRYSSNIGMAKIGQNLGKQKFHNYLQELGFGQRTGVPVAESRGILRRPRDWSDIDLMATSFGQSISVTGLQMAQAYLTLLNGGLYTPLRLIKSDEDNRGPRKRIFSERVSNQVMQMMRDVVEEKDGTGRRARVPGMEVGGKTGTAQKADRRAGTYGNKRTASFVGFFPAKKPQYFILVMVDEPANNQFGGVVAAPVFSEIAQRALTHYGMLTPPEQPVEQEKKALAKQRVRGLKLAMADAPYTLVDTVVLRQNTANLLDLPGQLAKGGSHVPDVIGKPIRNAVEMFARAGVVPELKGAGNRVVKQSPPAGTAWPKDGEPASYILWLSER